MLRRLAIAATACLAISGCAQASSTVAGIAPSSTTSLANVVGDCPTPHPAAKAGQGVAVDYADFVQSGGAAFVADRELAVSADDKGPLQFRVRCPLGLLNDATHLMPPDARDGDSSYLPAGTEVFAVTGSPTRCRLMARGPEGWQAYAPRPTPSGCPATTGASGSPSP